MLRGHTASISSVLLQLFTWVVGAVMDWVVGAVAKGVAVAGGLVGLGASGCIIT